MHMREEGGLHGGKRGFPHVKLERPRLRLRGRSPFEATLVPGATSRRTMALRPSHALPTPVGGSGGDALASDLASGRCDVRLTIGAMSNKVK